jgi:IS30 family transposase
LVAGADSRPVACERSSVRVCHETIYRFAYSSDGRDMKLWRHCRKRVPGAGRAMRGVAMADGSARN